ncbi:MAG TPA: dimethylarginine dimethylaminohydrolase [Parvularcula sp.]|nr:dimethylarginine dimethylaminohydrolase [Parvularcula sp.]
MAIVAVDRRGVFRAHRARVFSALRGGAYRHNGQLHQHLRRARRSQRARAHRPTAGLTLYAPFSFKRALVRAPSKSVTSGLRAHGGEGPSYDGVAREHRAYIAALAEADITVEILPPLEEFPDAVFIEDPALVFPEGAILLRPGAPSRYGEAAALAKELTARFDETQALDVGFADGGDVLNLGDRILIGVSARTNEAGAERLARLLEKFGRRAEAVATPPGVLHFKTDCALIDHETVLATPRLAKSGFFKGFRLIETALGEERAANALRVNGDLLITAGCPRTAERLSDVRARVIPLSTAEIAKIDAGLSCMSLRW